MIPKEKALELVRTNFEILAKASGYKGMKSVADTHTFGKLEALSKKLAEKTIECIIKENHFLDDFKVELTGKLVKRIEYWEQVKAEMLSL
ncbi:MAG: hypothetical protein WC389_06575 [Lutibacter sp.]|jgi:glycine cleavage system pyridoxal-binding protein P